MKGPGWGIVILFSAICLIVGGTLGFFIGVATSEFGQMAWDEASMVEKEADVGNPTSLARAPYSLQYPGNWSIDIERSDYDPDRFFYIDTPGGSYVEITIEDYGTEPSESLDEKISWYEDYFSNPEFSNFDQYGSFTGTGRVVKCRGLGYGETYRFFVYSDGNRTLIISEYVYEPDRTLNGAGFDLIERTLKLN